MKRLLSILSLGFLLLLAPSISFAGNLTDSDSTKAYWEPVMNAVMQVESHGNQFAKNSNSCGALQITPILVAECNNIFRRKKVKKRFRLSDRFSISKSKEMFMLIQSFYNPTNSIEFAIRSWNGGLHYSISRTQHYFEKVMNLIR
jgi:hypothetical protein